MSPLAPLRILLVDDEAPARKRLRTLLGDLAAVCPHEIVGEAANGQEALALLATTEADVALVDIRMPGMDGMALARQLAAMARPPALIFVTAYETHALQAFEVSAIDYLLKPVRTERLQQALAKVLRPTANSADNAGNAPASAPRRHLTCHERGKLLLVPLADILYLRADLKYVVARTAERDYLLDESLVQLEQEFAAHFIRTHRSTLVARQAITGFVRGNGNSGDGDEEAGEVDGGEQWLVLLRGCPDKLPVSRRQWPLLRESVARGE